MRLAPSFVPVPVLLLLLALALALAPGCQKPWWEKIDETEIVTTIRDEHFAYDPAANAWAGRPGLPAANLAQTGVVAPGSGRLYIMAGGTDAVYRFDPAANSGAGAWETLPPLPEPRGDAIAVAVSRTVCVATGEGVSGGPIPFVDVLDDAAATPTWERIPTLPFFQLSQAAVVATGDALFVIGGRTAAGIVSAEVWKLEPVTTTATWVKTGDMSVPRAFPGSFLLAGKIHVLSGDPGSGALLLSEDVIDAATGAVLAPRSILTARIAPQAVVIGDRALVFDARTPAVGPTGNLDSFRESEGWTPRVSHPRAMVMSSAVGLSNGLLLVAGGWRPSESSAQAHVYDPGTNAWTPAAGMLFARHFGILVEVGGRASYVGGVQAREQKKKVSAGDFLGFPF